jgi:predicted Zn-ribbon and HTH transcriptional regulator
MIGQAIKRGELEWIHTMITIKAKTSEKIYLYLHGLDKLPLCDRCGGPVKFTNYTRGFQTFCSNRCKGQHNQAVNGEEIHKKSKKTLQARYGVSSPLQLPAALAHHKAASLKRRGVPLSEDHKKKTRETLIERYGAPSTFRSPVIRKKIDKTMTDRYGGYYVASEEMRDLHQARRAERVISKLREVYETELLEDFTHTKNPHSARCTVCSTEFKIRLANGGVSRCPRCYFIPANRSLKEAELSEWIQALGFTVESNAKRGELIYPMEIDIWIPEIKTAVEFHGNYWHRESLRGQDSHLKRLNACLEKGFSMIQIFEYEYDNKREQTLSRLRSLLGKNELRVNARECTVQGVAASEEREFLERFHLQGYVASALCVGSYHRGELISLMSFGRPRFSRKHDHELLRFASRSNTTVRGGAQKLFSACLKQIKGSIISYRDKRWGSSNFYQKLGFVHSHDSKPGYVYSKHDQVISRHAAQKSRLPALLGDKFDETLTETENMVKSRYCKLWDCGQEVYVK